MLAKTKKIITTKCDEAISTALEAMQRIDEAESSFALGNELDDDFSEVVAKLEELQSGVRELLANDDFEDDEDDLDNKESMEE